MNSETDHHLPLHRWDVTPQQAIELQKQLASQVVREGKLVDVHRIAGVDVSFNPRLPESPVHAVVVVLEYPSLDVGERRSVSEVVNFPYVPGLLSFREAPPILKAIAQLEKRPDLLLVDGQGYAHPRHLGIASHLGLLLDLPAIGCAKSILVGHPAGNLGEQAGSKTDLLWKNRVIGQVVRTRDRVQPLYVSVGHRLDLESAVDWVLRCGRGYRLPEPTRQAHLFSNQVRRAML
ncbi:deoxyribonuclease V [Gloeobacter kilaueensis]|uniref:Endonuclease V n=1 Tax=Gloeobacter kilaueensis (strain ATCC BAA-2537 / CCAP 1431/1 / ULC 316 / JS1) TaxID=1183438 RepID=U5QER8_GLOK1|nr:deoxyribonuclease V [Gloeobacter kilaueensis]AGY57406.1 endonuclease V [Gloeobacter kilaueensis JS1]